MGIHDLHPSRIPVESSRLLLYNMEGRDICNRLLGNCIREKIYDMLIKR